MKLEQLNSIGDIRRYLSGTDIIDFNVVTTKQERYQWIHKALKKVPKGGSIFDAYMGQFWMLIDTLMIFLPK
jgi:hypothetical protein